MIPPHSRKNCVYTSIATCRTWHSNIEMLTDHTKQNQAGADLKRRHGPENRREAAFATNETIQHLCNKLRFGLHMYDNTFKLIKTFLPRIPVGESGSRVRVAGTYPMYNVQSRDGHLWALLPRDEVARIHPTFTMPAFSEEILPKELEKKPYVIVPAHLRGK